MRRLLLLLLLFPLPLLAQTGAVTGVALDSIGNTVAGATITVCPNGSSGIPCTPVTASTTSNGQGAFSVVVPIGTYTVTVFRLGVVATSSTVVVAPSNVTVANNVTYSGSVTFTGAITATNLTASGTATLAKINGVCAVDGTTNTTLAAAVTCAGSNGTVQISPGFAVPALTAGVTIPAGVTLRFDGGSTAIPLGNFNLTINGQIQAPPVQIFNYSGTGVVTGAAGSPGLSVVQAAWFPGVDMCVALQNAHGAMPNNRGGIIDARSFTGAQACGTQLAITKTITILLNRALVLTCNTTTSPCITANDVPYSVIGDLSADDSSFGGPSIVAGTSTSYLLEAKTTVNGNDCKNTTYQGILLNGTNTSKGIHIQNCLSVNVMNDTFDNLLESVTFENTNGLFSETSNLYSNWFNNCVNFCVNFILNGGTTSFSNQTWGRNYFQLNNSNSIGVNFPSTGQCGQCDLGSIKMWDGAATTNVVGFKNRGDMTGADMRLFMFEGGFGTSGTVAWDSTTSIEPTVSAFRVSPTCGTSDMAVSCVIHGTAWTNSDANRFSLSGPGRISFNPGSGLGTAGFGSCTNSFPGLDTFGDPGTGFYNIDQVNHQLAVGIQGCRTLFIGKNIMSFEPGGDGNRRVQIDSTGLTMTTVGGASTPLQFVEGSPTGSVFTGQDECDGDSTLHGIICNFNNTTITSPIKSVALTADWTCGTGGTVASCTSATIIGSGGGVPLTLPLPLGTGSWTLECNGVVGQATAVTLNQWNLLTATNGATNVTATYDMFTAATAAAAGAVTDQAATTTTFQITPSWTLGAITTKMPFHIWARIEGSSASGTVVSLQLVAPTVGDLVTIYRGTSCRLP